MPANVETVRRIALALPGVEEGICHGTPAFYVRRKLILRVWEDGETLVVACPKAVRSERIEFQPDVFFLTEHYRNYDYVLMSLLAVGESVLREAIENAWRLKASKRELKARDAAAG